MENEIKKYALGLNANQEIISWLEKVLTGKENQSEVEHIIDYLIKNPKKLERATYSQQKKMAEKWIESLRKKGEHIKETKDDIEIIKEWKKDGFKIVKLVGENAYKREGFLMRHCVASYYGKDVEIYSLRDKDNMPHCTIEKDTQIKGKGNGSIHPRYIKYVVEFLEEMKMEVRDSEMENLGYINIKNIQDENAIFPKKYLFRDEYFFKENIDKIIDKNGKRYENITLWKSFGLFEFDTKLKVKFLFSLEKCIENFRNLFKNDKKDYNKVAMTSYNKVAMTDNNKVAMTDNNKVAMTDNNKIKSENNNIISVRYSNEIETGTKSVVVAGNQSKIKGKIGSLLVFYEKDKNGVITNHKTVLIDGAKIKEDTWYELVNGKLK